MTVDDLSAPLGQQPPKLRRKLPIAVLQGIAGALALFLAVFVSWAIIVDNPFGGEPMVVVSLNQHTKAAAEKPRSSAPAEAATRQSAPGYDASPNGSAAGAAGRNTLPPGAKTISIIDGKTGARQEVVIPDAVSDGAAVSPAASASEQKFLEVTPQGLLPKIAGDGTRPAEAFARPVQPIPGKPDAPRIAIVIGGLGVSANATAEAISKTPGPVTLAFMPYGANLEFLAAQAHAQGHEILLQVPMEPFGYPDNDSGPQTLLTSLTPEQNMTRLHWLMSRIRGYVGVTGVMGARFTASDRSFAPILTEVAKRGLIFVDDGVNARSVAGRIADANNLPFAKTDVVIDSVPTPVEVDRALSRLEMTARERGLAVGMASALPVSLDHIAKWAKSAASRGFLLVPITAAVLKQS
jgi:uncharacterized protein